MEHWDHPDLVRLDRLLSARLEETLRAEQYAARLAMQRRLTIRDRLLDFEDRAEPIAASLTNGSVRGGIVDAVGLDHVVVRTDDESTLIALAHIVSVTIGERR